MDCKGKLFFEIQNYFLRIPKTLDVNFKLFLCNSIFLNVNSKNFAFVLAFLAALIYGLSFTIAKDVMPLYIKPFGFILLRVTGATLLFWVAGLLVPSEKIEWKDFKIIILSAFFGVALNMLTFFKGLSYTTPINSAVIMVTTPILVLLFSFVFLKDPFTTKKIIGVVMGLIGAVALISLGKKMQVNAPNVRLGNFLVFINAASFSVYMIISKGIIHKYHPINVTKWMYLVGILMVLPFSWSQIQEVQWEVIPFVGFLKIGYIVVFATFFTYLFNILALKKLKPTTLSVFIYIQPVVATLYAISVGSDRLDWLKIVAASLIFIGVYLVSFRKTER
ncbi:MAG: EamA family transporter [Flavobacteriaceae bacterium]|nr:EamA family transporter [Flavobacteriaceae bacterium]